VYASWPVGGVRKEVVVKLLSVDLSNYPDAPTEGSYSPRPGSMLRVLMHIA
jgi:hypothetical protein